MIGSPPKFFYLTTLGAGLTARRRPVAARRRRGQHERQARRHGEGTGVDPERDDDGAGPLVLFEEDVRGVDAQAGEQDEVCSADEPKQHDEPRVRGRVRAASFAARFDRGR